MKGTNFKSFNKNNKLPGVHNIMKIDNYLSMYVVEKAKSQKVFIMLLEIPKLNLTCMTKQL